LAAHDKRRPQEGNPAIIINSIDLKKVIRLVTENLLGDLTDYLLTEIKRLASAGAECGLLSANTPHIVFHDLAGHSPIPLVSIVEATCGKAKRLGMKKIGLFGTRFTMQGQFYPEVFAREGIRLVIPGEEEQNFIHDKYMSELIPGIFLDQTRDRLLAIAGRLKEQDGIEGLILGGTELPLILQDNSPIGIPFLDTTQIHVNAILDYALA
jgi:aspartate racemase